MRRERWKMEEGGGRMEDGQKQGGQLVVPSLAHL